MANLYELENRVFTESWSIPYKREESLGKCLAAATRLAHEGKFCSFWHLDINSIDLFTFAGHLMGKKITI